MTPTRLAFAVFLAFLALEALPATAAPLTNPLGTTDLNVIIGRVIQAILGVSGSVALLMFIYGGFWYLIAGGDSNKVKEAQAILKNAFFGLVIIIGAYMIVKTIITALESGTVA